MELALREVNKPYPADMCVIRRFPRQRPSGESSDSLSIHGSGPLYDHIWKGLGETGFSSGAIEIDKVRGQSLAKS